MVETCQSSHHLNPKSPLYIYIMVETCQSSHHLNPKSPIYIYIYNGGDMSIFTSPEPKISNIYIYIYNGGDMSIFTSPEPRIYVVLSLPKVFPYNLRISNLLTLPNIKPSSYGILYFSEVANIIWNTVSDYIKSPQSLSIFKFQIKNWQGELCNCQICSR